MTTITFDHPKGAVTWTVDPDGHISDSQPTQDYTGCHVLDLFSLLPGHKPSYQTPTRKRTVLFDYPIATILTR